MRLIVDTLIAVMLAAILAAVLLAYRRDQVALRQQQMVHRTLARMQEQMLFHAALGEGGPTRAGFARDVSPLWFKEGVPLNPAAPGGHPWLDVAPEHDLRDHPVDPVIVRPEQAGFWYNPNRGIFRARVVPQATDRATLELYNRLNGAVLASLPRPAASPASGDGREAIAAAPSSVTAAPTPPTLRDAGADAAEACTR